MRSSPRGWRREGSQAVYCDPTFEGAFTQWGECMFAGLPPADSAILQAALRRRTYRRGEVVFHRGDPGDTLHIVRRGRLKIVAPTDSGEEAVLTILGPGDLFGEITLLDGG